MTNAPTGNYVLTTAIGADGKLTIGSAFSAKGTGSLLSRFSPPFFLEKFIYRLFSNWYRK